MLRAKPEEPLARDTHAELPIDPDVVRPGTYKWPPHFTPRLLLMVFVGGCLGTAARYWVALMLPSNGTSWPVATLVVNLLGAFLLGLLLEGLVRLGRDTGVRRVARLGIGTGFMGGFTTYSTLAVNTSLLLRSDHASLGLTYAITSVTGGVICSAVGIQLAAVHQKQRKGTQ
jgi:CrcB protein